MKKFLFAVVAIVILIAALGYWRGWFEFGARHDQGGVGANVNVNVNKFKQDKENFKKYLAEKSRSMKDKLAALKDKAKGLRGEARAKADKEIDSLTKKHSDLEAKAKQVDDTAEEHLEGLMKSVKSELEPPAGDGKDGQPDKPNG
jgi:hypothetical protein